jgi:hypothetical protein
MGKIVRLRIYIFAFCIPFLSACAAMLDRPSDKIEGDADTALRTFSQKHSLPYAELKARLDDVEQGLKKGGLTMIAPHAYIALNDSRNTLVFPNREWHGKESSAPEIVMTEGVRIIDSLKGVDSTKIIVVFFLPSEVRRIRLGGGKGYYFKRGKQMSPEEAKAYLESLRPKSAE